MNSLGEATLRLSIRGQAKKQRGAVAVIDTGFSGSLTLPSLIIRRLGLPLIGRSEAELADGSVVSFSMFAGEVKWSGRWVPIEVNEAPGAPLIGMELLDEHELNVRVRRGGAVTIRRLA